MNVVYLILGAGILLMLANVGQQTLSPDAVFELNQLSQTYGSANVQRLINLYNAIQNAVNPDNSQPLTVLQQQLMLSQSLEETGLFTDNPNYNLMDNYNNYSGIKGNSRYAAGPNGFAKYPTLTAFVNDWLYLLTINNDPLNATGPTDFINRLLSNGYIVSTDLPGYQSGIPQYYNMLQNIAA